VTPWWRRRPAGPHWATRSTSPVTDTSSSWGPLAAQQAASRRDALVQVTTEILLSWAPRTGDYPSANNRGRVIVAPHVRLFGSGRAAWLGWCSAPMTGSLAPTPWRRTRWPQLVGLSLVPDRRNGGLAMVVGWAYRRSHDPPHPRADARGFGGHRPVPPACERRPGDDGRRGAPPPLVRGERDPATTPRAADQRRRWHLNSWPRRPKPARARVSPWGGRLGDRIGDGLAFHRGHQAPLGDHAVVSCQQRPGHRTHLVATRDAELQATLQRHQKQEPGPRVNVRLRRSPPPNRRLLWTARHLRTPPPPSAGATPTPF
jgi:hypothetical protein